jgi:hypothetical protein
MTRPAFDADNAVEAHAAANARIPDEIMRSVAKPRTQARASSSFARIGGLGYLSRYEFKMVFLRPFDCTRRDSGLKGSQTSLIRYRQSEQILAARYPATRCQTSIKKRFDSNVTGCRSCRQRT